MEANWLRTFKRSNFAFLVDKPTYYKNERPIVRNLLKHAQTVIVTAHNNPDQFQAFMNFQMVPAHDTIILNYIYVKRIYRRLGYARRMLEKLIPAPELLEKDRLKVVCTYDTKDFEPNRKRFGFAYNPYLIRGTL